MQYFGKSRLIQQGEAGVVLLVAFILAWLFIYIDAFELFTDFVKQQENWELDELASVVFVVSLASIVLLFRRSREMRREIDWREEAEAEANKLARHDPLTGLPNRRQFNEVLTSMLASIKNSAYECAVFLIDLDRFKSVNDIHGHGVGDELLVEVAARLKTVCESGTSIARLGGDEFVCILRYRVGSEAPASLAGRIIRTLGEPFDIGGVQLDAQATVGVARCPIDATAPSDLLRAADVAMYEGKRAERACTASSMPRWTPAFASEPHSKAICARPSSMDSSGLFSSLSSLSTETVFRDLKRSLDGIIPREAGSCRTSSSRSRRTSESSIC